MENVKEKKSLDKTELFGSFYLNEAEFAISAMNVQEVVNAPDKLTEMPLAPAFLLGLFNLRGAIVPVISLQKLLNLPEPELASPVLRKKIAIVEQGSHCIGFLFDRTGEIFRSQSDERNDFNDVGAPNVISGIFKKDQGKRLLQILNVSQLFRLQGLPLQTDAQGLGNRQHLRKPKGLRKQCISFQVGPARCALGINEIKEIIKLDQLKDASIANDNCIGVVNLRGAMVPVIDFAGLLRYRKADKSEQARNPNQRVMILKIDQEHFGLMVDSVESIVAYHQEDLKPFPVIQNPRATMFNACISTEDQGDILLLNYDKILIDKEIVDITHGHSKLFQAQLDKNPQESAGARSTFITFSIDSPYAVRIGEVREIIEMPSELLNPPGLPHHCKGLLNHRGQIVTVIDARSLYGRPPMETRNEKLMIFKKEENMYGLVVDSVEGIVSFGENHKMKLPDSLYKNSNGPSADAIEAFQVKSTAPAKDLTLFVLSLESLAARVVA